MSPFMGHDTQLFAAAPEFLTDWTFFRAFCHKLSSPPVWSTPNRSDSPQLSSEFDRMCGNLAAPDLETPTYPTRLNTL